MDQAKGWLFDVYIQDKEAIIWIKIENGDFLRFVDNYTPYFYIKPTDNTAEQEILYRLSGCGEVRNIFTEDKITSIRNNRKERLIKVEVDGNSSYKELVKALEYSPLVSKLYNVGLRQIQKYLFTKLKIEPTSKVLVEYGGDRISNIEKIDDSFEIIPSPFSVLQFQLDYESSKQYKKIKGITIKFKDKTETFRGNEYNIIASFLDYVSHLDVDLLFCPKCDKFTFPLLKKKTQDNGLNLIIGRCNDREQVRAQGSIGGRIILGEIFCDFSVDGWGIAGLVERTRFSFAPIGLTTRWRSNRSIDSRNCFELTQKGYVIQKEEYGEHSRSLYELIERDRGGIAITPEIGRVHENVAALDFDSQYPNIILKNRLSYESISKMDEEFRLIPTVIEPWLNRRMYLKRVRKTFPKNSMLRLYCQQRVDALKSILVTQYGISGCCWNRFGSVLTFEEINKKSREAMLKAKAIAESNGFRIVYGDTDSLFVKKVRAVREDYEELASKISDVTTLPMSLDRHFKFIAFLPLKGDPTSSALKRYFGLTYDGEVEARGIELRRHDTPPFIKEFQIELIRQVLDCESTQEVYLVGVKRGVEMTKNSLKMIKDGKVDFQELLVEKTLRKEVNQYKSNVAHRSAALQLLYHEKELEVGDDIPFLYIDRYHKNPLCRVKALEFAAVNYDKETYAKMLTEAASIIFKGLGTQPILGPTSETLKKWL